MTTIVYNRPATVESVYSDVAEVRFEDNGLLSYVARGGGGAMSRHYGRFERTSMDAQTLLAVDPVHWQTYADVVEGDDCR
jgi:hypothetical protein